jgi:hypothetical protein
MTPSPLYEIGRLQYACLFHCSVTCKVNCTPLLRCPISLAWQWENMVQARGLTTMNDRSAMLFIKGARQRWCVDYVANFSLNISFDGSRTMGMLCEGTGVYFIHRLTTHTSAKWRRVCIHSRRKATSRPSVLTDHVFPTCFFRDVVDTSILLKS